MWLRRHISASSCSRLIRMSIPFRLFSRALSHTSRGTGGVTVAVVETAEGGRVECPPSRFASSACTAGRIASAWGPANACSSSRRQRGSSRHRNGTATTRSGVEPCTGSGGPPSALIRAYRLPQEWARLVANLGVDGSAAVEAGQVRRREATLAIR